MSISISKFARRSIASAAGAALMLGVVAAPAQADIPAEVTYAQESPAPADLSSFLPPQVAEALFLIVAVPVIGSSVLSSVIGIPQCGLHDTTGCPVG